MDETSVQDENYEPSDIDVEARDADATDTDA
jgi:hypothetical protein